MLCTTELYKLGDFVNIYIDFAITKWNEYEFNAYIGHSKHKYTL